MAAFNRRNDRVNLLNIGDGPEGILIYTSEDEGSIDHSNKFPAMYMEVAIHGAAMKFGPFQTTLYDQLIVQLKSLGL